MQAEHTYEQFIEREGLSADVDWAASNPNIGDMPAGSTHYLVTIRKDDESMVVPFSQGPAITREPSLETVLDCLASDAASIEDSSFDDWAEELGYFPIESGADYRRAEQAYRVVQQQSEALRTLLGDEAFESLLYATERL